MKKYSIIFLLFFAYSTHAQDATPQSIIEKYLEVIGGQVAIAQVNDITMEMEGEVQGQKLSLLVQKKKPNKFLTSIIVDGMGEVNKIVFDGEKGFTSAMGAEKIIEGEDAKMFLSQSEIVGEVLYLTDLSKLELMGKETINDVECYVLKIKNAVGEAKEYYDVKTGLKIRQVNETESPMGKVTATTDYGNYKEVNGIKFPHKLKQDMGMVAFELEMREIKLNQNLADTIFATK